MPGNKFLLADKSKLLKTKLETISKKLQGSIDSGELQTQEEYIFEAIKVIGTFYKDLKEPLLAVEDITEVRQDDMPDPTLYNKLWQDTLDDLITIFTELENIESLTVANFNFITTESNRLTARLKAVSSLLGDFILYTLNANRDSFYFKDSFNDLSKVDVNSALLNKEECEVSQAEGIVTLPIDQEQDSIVKVDESPIVNPNSNGVAGNNQEIGADFNGSLSVLLDNNPDTWFEYERVVTAVSEDEKPLVLDLTLNIGKEVIVNHIRVNPNNFGTKTIIKIDEIETSIDGQNYISIKDDIPIADFVEEDEDNVFSLAPGTSKFAGQGIYTFTPRKIKYIHLVFKQTEAYAITTNVGLRQRFAIGIRDIDVRNFIYKNAGELISTAFNTTDEVRKVLLQSNQNPTETSELASITWSVSPDDGANWYEIQPKEFFPESGAVSVPEILEFNGPSEDTITTPVPVKSLRVKSVLERDDDKFKEGTSSLNKTITSASETYEIPEASPFTIQLLNPPVEGTIVIVDPQFGSRGKPEDAYILGNALDRLANQKFRLPFTFLPRPVKKVGDSATPEKFHIEPVPANEWVHIEAGGEEWFTASGLVSTFTGGTARVYNLDLLRGILSFGNDVNTKAPANDTPVTMRFDAERLFPDETEGAHKAKLDFHTSNNKEEMTIKRFDESKKATEVLPRKATVVNLKNENLTDTAGIVSAIDALTAITNGRITFLNGKDEFTAPGATAGWSMDDEHGRIYLTSATPDNQDVSVNYTYDPIVILDSSEWDWATDSILRDSVAIKESAWLTRTIKDEEVPATQNISILDLSRLSVEKDTLNLRVSVSGTDLEQDNIINPFQKEVTFIDGVTELGGEIIQTVENIIKNIVSASSGIGSFDLKENVSEDTNHAITFSKSANTFNLANTPFVSENTFVDGSSELTNPGDYSIDRVASSSTYGKVFIRLAATGVVTLVDAGTVTYFYSSPNFGASGLYSVNYKLGQIYTQLGIDTTNQTTWRIFASYEWSDFRAEYRIARLVNAADYTIDVVEQSISLKDSEIFKHLNIPKQNVTGRTPYYLVNYDYVATSRENIEELKDSFSPVIKDFALRVLTKGSIF